MGVLENRFKDNIIVASLDKFLSWARSTSPWYFQFGLACCAIEMMAMGSLTIRPNGELDVATETSLSLSLPKRYLAIASVVG